MDGSEEIRRRAEVVDEAARSVRAVRAVVDGLGSSCWRSPAAVAFRVEVDRLVGDLARTGGWLESLAADLRHLAALVSGVGRG
jgi:hypothetical protein